MPDGHQLHVEPLPAFEPVSGATAWKMMNVMADVATTKATPPPTIEPLLDPPLETVMAIQMNPATKPASNALTIRDRLDTSDGSAMRCSAMNGTVGVQGFVAEEHR